jgi:hypothetical protein
MKTLIWMMAAVLLTLGPRLCNAGDVVAMLELAPESGLTTSSGGYFKMQKRAFQMTPIPSIKTACVAIGQPCTTKDDCCGVTVCGHNGKCL